MADDDTTHSYQVNQDNKEYIVTTQLINDALRDVKTITSLSFLYLPNFSP